MLCKFVVKLTRQLYFVFCLPAIGLMGKLYLKGSGVTFGKNIRLIGFPRVRKYKNSKIILGDDIILHSNSEINAIGVNHEVILRTQSEKAEIIIGNGVGISGGAICAKTSVIIGNNVLIGSNVVIADNDFHSLDQGHRRTKKNNFMGSPVMIGDGAWVGADSYICKGVKIGEGAVIGAKSVVTKSISANCVAAGIPAAVVKNI